MAIEIEWQAKPSRKTEEGESESLFPRMRNNGIADENELYSQVAARSPLSKGVLEEALAEMAEYIGRMLAEGKTVRLPELGTFRLSLGTNGKVTAGNHRKTDKIVVRGINFTASDKLLQTIGKPDFRGTAGKTGRCAMKTDELKERLREYFKTHDSITRSEVEKAFHLRRSTAIARLRALADEGFLTVAGRNSETRYVKGNNP